MSAYLFAELCCKTFFYILLILLTYFSFYVLWFLLLERGGGETSENSRMFDLVMRMASIEKKEDNMLD